MKYIWEERDIKPGIKIKPSNGASEIWMIAYDSSKSQDTKYCLASLSDGAIVLINCSKQSLADKLNDTGYIPLP